MVKVNIDKENMILTISEIEYEADKKSSYIIRSNIASSIIDISKIVKCSIGHSDCHKFLFVSIYFNEYKDSIIFDDADECQDVYNKISDFMIDRNKILNKIKV